MVDDSAESAELLAEVAALRGYRVHVAYTGRQALALAKAHAIDAVLLDLHLGTESGIEVAERLGARGNPPVLIALSGLPTPPAHESLFAWSELKPPDLDRLFRRLDRRLRQARPRE